MAHRALNAVAGIALCLLMVTQACAQEVRNDQNTLTVQSHDGAITVINAWFVARNSDESEHANIAESIFNLVQKLESPDQETESDETKWKRVTRWLSKPTGWIRVVAGSALICLGEELRRG